MENPAQGTRCDSSVHPYSYLTFLNQLYSYYQQDEQNSRKKNSKFRTPTKSFKKMKIPDVFYKNYLQQKSLQDSSNRKKQVKENKNDTSRIWIGHAESLKKYRRMVSGSKSRMKHYVPAEEETRICKQDSKNIFLKKLVKAGKIPSYDRQELHVQVLANLNTLNNENWRAVTNRNVRTVQSACRPKSQVLPRHPQTAKPGGVRQQLNKSGLAGQLQQQMKTMFGNKTGEQQERFQTLFDFRKQAQALRCFDGSISSKNVDNIQRFVGRVRELQSAARSY